MNIELQIVKALVSCLCLLLAAGSSVSANVDVRKFDEFGAINCEDEMAHLDNYALSLQNEPNLQAYILIYGGRRDTARAEVRVRGTRMKRYLVKSRGLDRRRVRIVNGGFHEKLTVELWLVPPGKELPKTEPTISPKDVKYRRGNFGDNCSNFY